MDFSNKLTRAAAVMTWARLVIGVAAVLLMDRLGAPADVTLHLWAYLGWAVFGVAVALSLTFLPSLAARSPYVLANLNAFRALLLIGNTVWVTAGASVTGGVKGPFWLFYIGVVLFAAVSMPGWQAALFGLASSAGLVIATSYAGELDASSAGSLVLIGALFPVVAWFNATLSSAVWELRSAAREQRQQLEDRVEELSAVLARAADGDLAVVADGGVDEHHLQTLSSAFNHTIGNLRELVGQIRSGG